MPVHDAVKWALRAETVRVPDDYRPSRPRRDVDMSMTQGWVKLEVAFLIENIEVDLKRRLETFLRRRGDSTWWSTLPLSVQKKSALRFKWAAEEIGVRRLRYPDITWLSFGDVLAVLGDFTRSEWRVCMAAETDRRLAFTRLLRAVKAFRDQHVAHPKSRNATGPEIKRMLTAVKRMPETIRLTEWRAALCIVAAIKTAPIQERKDVIWEGMGLAKRSDALERWSKAREDASLFASARRETRWRREVFSYLAGLDPGGSHFFGIPL